MFILGIETSCDETAAAVVQDGQRLLSNVVASSVDLHAAFGGVVPEIAARSHLEVITPVIDQAIKEAEVDWQQIDKLAVTFGPGLLGSLLIGVLAARTLAIVKNKPLVAVNHVESHPYAAFLTAGSTSLKNKYQFPTAQPQFPMLALIVSGGHSQLALFKSHGDYRLLGQTADDAVGEAFDKVAKILGLPYPGGPSVSAAAAKGDSDKYKLPVATMPGLDFSFSGLKTAVLRAAQATVGKSFDFPSVKLPGLLNESQKADLAASFQKAAIAALVAATKKAEQQYKPASIVVAGGVAANQALRQTLINSLSTPVTFPDFNLCTDNGAMIATLASYYRGKPSDPYSLEASPSLSM